MWNFKCHLELKSIDVGSENIQRNKNFSKTRKLNPFYSLNIANSNKEMVINIFGHTEKFAKSTVKHSHHALLEYEFMSTSGKSK